MGLGSVSLTQVGGCESYHFGANNGKNGRYVLQGDTRSPLSATSEKLGCDFLLVNNSNLHPILRHFNNITQYWSSFCCIMPISTMWCHNVTTRVIIPGRPGIPVIFRSRIPGNGAASFPAKTGMVL